MDRTDRAERIGGEFLMATYLTNDTDLGAVADAIRTKGGTSADLVFPQGFVDAIDAISGGGPSADDYAQKLVPSGLIRLGVSTVMDGAFWYCKNITGVVIDVACTIKENSFKNCNAMTFFVSQSTTTIGGQTCLAYNTGLLTIDINTPSLAKSLCLANNTKLASLILRRTASITSANQSNALQGSRSTTKPIHVYVPSALKATYESATNWSTWVNDGTIIFEELEGSAYESEDWWKS